MRSLQIVGIGLLLSGLVGCGSTQDDQDQVEMSSHALVVSPQNVFGFEDATQWQSTVALSSSTTHSQGSKSLGVKAKGYVEVNSVALSSLTGVTSMLSIDVQLPAAQSNPSWYGFIQLQVSVPSKGVYNAFLGQQELTGRPLLQFLPLTFNLPSSLVTTLQAGGYQDFKIKVVVNVPWDETGTYLFDNMHFLADCPTACGAHGACNRSTLACDCSLGARPDSSCRRVLAYRRTVTLPRFGRTSSAKRAAMLGWSPTTMRSRRSSRTCSCSTS